MSSGARSNLILASRYPEDIAALVIAPLTGGPYAAARLSEDYFFKYLANKKLTTRKHVNEVPIRSMEDLARTDLWTQISHETLLKSEINFLPPTLTTSSQLWRHLVVIYKKHATKPHWAWMTTS